MRRYIGDEGATMTPVDNIGQPVSVASPDMSGQMMIDAQRTAERTALAEQDQPGLFGRFLNNTLTGIDNFYKEVESNYTAAIDFAGSAITGNERLDQEEVYEVSPGQALEANINALVDDSIRLADDDWRESQWGVSNRNPLDDDFRVNVTTGALDFAIDWFLDPLVLVGKGAKVLRFGTAFGRPVPGMSGGGLTHRLTSGKAGAGVVKQVGDDIDQAIANPNIQIGSVGKINQMAKDLAANDYNYALTVREFKGPNQGALSTAAAMINDEQTMKVFLGAMSGSQRHIDQLANIRNDIYTGVVKMAQPDLYERLAVNTAESKMPVALERFLEPGADGVKRIDAMRNNSDEFDSILRDMGYDDIQGINAATRLSQEVGGGAVIRDWRSPYQSAMYKQRNARKLRATKQGTVPAARETVFTDNFGMRTRLWTGTVQGLKQFAVGKESNGYVQVRGLEAGRGFTEIRAAATDSSVLRNSKFEREALDIWGRAVTPDQKFVAIKEIERRAFDIQVAHYISKSSRVGDEMKKLSYEDQRKVMKDITTLRDDMYKKIDERRADLLNQVRNTKQAYATVIDPDDGAQVIFDKRLRSQLSTAEPMLDMKVLQKTARILVDDFGRQYDFTQKQSLKSSAKKAEPTVEQTAKNLKTAAKRTTPQDLGGGTTLLRGTENYLDTGLSLWKAGVLIRLGYTQRNLFENSLRAVATIGILPMIARMPGGAVKITNNTYKRGKKATIVKRWNRRAAEEADKIANFKARISAGTLGLEKQLAESEAQLAALIEKIRKTELNLTGDAQKVFGAEVFGATGIRVGDEWFTPWDDVTRDLTSMDNTNRRTLSALIDGEADMTLSQRQYIMVNPGDPQYWDELNQAGVQFMEDEVTRRILRGEDADSIVKWMKSNDGRYYRDDMKTPIRGASDFVDERFEMVMRYLPTEKSRQMVANGDVAPAQLKAELGYLMDQRRLSPIHGREVEEKTKWYAGGLLGTSRRATNFVFKIIGDLPETHLSRQPFYDTVWRKEFNSRVALAQSQGQELTKDVLEGINRGAKQQALRDLKETLYTIEQYSTMAKYLRFIIPFFPAFQNTASTWARIVAKDPAVIPRADTLWNVPNSLGMVVDEDGEVVPYDRYGFIRGGDSNFIIMPQAVRDYTIEKFGIPFDIPQGSVNVVFPGETPFLPGFGPLIGMPMNAFLVNKPNVQEFLRDKLGETIYKNIVPFGRTNPNLIAPLAPSGWRKVTDWMGGEGNDVFLGIAGAIMRDLHFAWLENGGLSDEKYTAEEVIDKTNNYFLMSVLASFAGPVSVAPGSANSLALGYWRRMLEDPTLTYDERIKRLEEKFGPNAAVLVTSTSEKVKGIGYTLEDYQQQDKYKGLARDLGAIDTDLVGLISSGVPAGEFDQGSYVALGKQTVPGTNTPYRERKRLSQMEGDLTLSTAWDEYNEVKEARDKTLEQMGVSINSNAASQIRDMWNYFKYDYMEQKYGQPWATAINGYEKSQGQALQGITVLLNNEEFMSEHGDEPMWMQVREYMEVRASAQQAIFEGADSSTVNDMWAQYREQVRYSTLLFSDFFDMYLEDDESIQDYAAVD